MLRGYLRPQTFDLSFIVLQKWVVFETIRNNQSYKEWVRVLDFLLKFIITFLFGLRCNHCTMPLHQFGATPLPWRDWNWFLAWRHWNLLLGEEADEPATGAAEQICCWSINLYCLFWMHSYNVCDLIEFISMMFQHIFWNDFPRLDYNKVFLVPV